MHDWIIRVIWAGNRWQIGTLTMVFTVAIPITAVIAADWRVRRNKA
jgi:hypothetical protein